jgi:hypothetical protein
MAGNEEVIDDFRQESADLLGKVHDRERLRSKLAYLVFGLIAILELIIICSAVAGVISPETAKDLALALVAPMIAIFAIMVGFYYGQSTT